MTEIDFTRIENNASYQEGIEFSRDFANNRDNDFWLGFHEGIVTEHPAVQQSYLNEAIDIIETLANMNVLGNVDPRNENTVAKAREILKGID